MATIAAIVLLACCFARSDAQIERSAYPSINNGGNQGLLHSPSFSRVAHAAFDYARANGVVTSAQEMLTTTKMDSTAGEPARVAPLRIDTEMHARRVYESAQPILRFSSHLAPGQRRPLREGVRGIAWVTERVTYWNDAVVSRQLVSREVVRKATPGVVLMGTPKTLAQLRSLTGYRTIAATITMIATAYTADTATAYPTGFTATGILAHQGIVAVDPSVIPLGSMVFVPGYGIAVAADTGGAIIGRRIDLCMDSYGDAVNFGRQTVQVYVLGR